MGRIKSTILMVLLSIVIVALCALTAFPAFSFVDGIQGWQPAIVSLDAGSELRGGYYTYYYPQGVISATDYQNTYESYEDGSAAQLDYADQYVQYKGLYLEKDEDVGIFDDETTASADNVSATFKAEFDAVTQEIIARFSKKGFSQYRVAVVDDYALRVEVPAPARHAWSSEEPDDQNSILALQAFSELGSLTIKNGAEDVDEFVKAESMTDFIDGFAVETEYGVSYIVAYLTGAGQSVIGGLKDGLSNYNPNDTSGTFLNFYVGETDTALMKVGKDNITSDMRIRYPIAYENNQAQAETYGILLNSALKTGGYDIQFTSSLINQTAEGNTMTFVYIALGAALLIGLVLPIIFFGKYGIANGYSTLSYTIIVALCYAFITGAVFEITLASLLMYLVGLVLVNLCSAYVYVAIKKEVDTGKTVLSAVKKGYNKTLWHIIDMYAVLLLAALALLIAVGGLFTLAMQALICVIAAAFCSLLWGRGINYVFLSACKDKYKYFRFARRDDEDEED